ncbi:MAG: OmpA family protein [Dysgonamonadaceae bacterium]|jgi:outer membrane protein OmpA-like peptidoglycan-associated protein|nr:OmpA family protein [Dysgonamonadaceae bacterium]
MRQLSIILAIVMLGGSLVFSSCGASNTVKGGGVGAAGGALLGAGLGAIFGGEKGALIGAGAGAALGGTAGVLIGKKMDKQAAELEQIEGAQVEQINEGQAIKVTFESGILFATGSSTLSAESRASLDQFAVSLRNNPDTDVQIQGHTDSSGGDRVNNPLSEKRALSVYNYLNAKGILENRMAYKGFGSLVPVATEDAKGRQALNRRVEVYILPNAKMIEEAKREAGQSR